MDINWSKVRRVLVVKLRSIGDTVLATPSLLALKRFLPNAEIDIVLEDWVAPVLEGFEAVDNIFVVGKKTSERAKIALALRRRKYDVAFNLHGGTTATMLVRASGAIHRVGLASYQYPFLYNHLLPSAASFWGRDITHSAEQQLAVLGFVGVPVEDSPKSQLAVTEAALRSVEERLNADLPSIDAKETEFALIHPATAFFTKQWPTENFAKIAELLADKGILTVAVASKGESGVLDRLAELSKVPIVTFDDLTLPEITALASKAKVFVGNDSGIAHIAASVQTPAVVIFGSSNRDHWSPWTDAPNEMVFETFECQPCPGYECAVYGDAPCIRNIPPSAVNTALERILSLTKG